MLLSLAIIIIFGSLFYVLFEKIKLPGLLGMLVLGVLMGPYGFNILSPQILLISSELRMIALIIILLRAGLGIKKDTLIKVGRPALLLSFFPGLLEGLTILFLSTIFFNFDFTEGGMLGFIIAAVSPAVVVPSMLKLMNEGKGEKKGIPTLLLAGASIDDVVAITIFTSFLGLYGGSQFNLFIQGQKILVAIFLGIVLGFIFSLILIKIFKKFHIRDTKKVLFLLSAGLILVTMEKEFAEKIEIAGLLGVMVIGFVLLQKIPLVAQRLATKLNKVWVFAELLLFVLVGAEVNIMVAKEAGLLGILLIFTGVLARSIGVFFSLIKSGLNTKEKIFCAIAYSPKATVQAAIGGIPLAMGVPRGEIILALAVLAIVITAPLGAIGIRYAGDYLLE
ncbi:cation:proton antiporter [Anaerobranca gottschalkii]|uniref:Sodium/proton antiporter, CPA1 family n=1 Tax=Anaerobranca gottschalkii DSM 13577 TaxID=1120990 RepID=A0A1H9YME5_9FIRM|nr:cation:proton antiporter [Anaerobranca gottschalkii]SES70302.1 sodium/proton antiporter, CPA1 family [Anaerobranca gottschalkii DSM 13577]